MSPTGLGKGSHLSDAVKSGFHRVVGQRLAGIGMIETDRHFFPLMGMGTDGMRDPISVPVGNGRNERPILLLDPSSFELLGQREMGSIGLGDQDQAARVAIKTMNNARSSRSTGTSARSGQVRA